MTLFPSLKPLRRLDPILVGAALALLTIGIAFIYSTGHGAPQAPVRPLYIKQLAWAGLGMLFFLFFAAGDYHRWLRASGGFYALGLLLLALVFVPHVGLKVYGARRWLQLAGVRILQPAELMKLATILLLARLFGRPGRNVRRPGPAWLGLALTLAPMLLIVRQPDLGTAMMFPSVLGSILWAAGVPGRRLAAWAGVGLALAGGLLALILLPPALGLAPDRHEALLRRLGISPYQRERIAVFLDRDRDPLGAGWNKAQSQIAVGSGRLLGKGFRKGTQNLLGFLPRTVAPNDFIFSVIAEESGFAGAAVTIALFGLLLAALLRAAETAADKFGRLLCVGFAALLFSHVFVNIAMTIGLLPITGIPLPLISYGGTFMIGTMSALGIAQSVHIRGDWR